jgi:hypothetical protein
VVEQIGGGPLNGAVIWNYFHYFFADVQLYAQPQILVSSVRMRRHPGPSASRSGKPSSVIHMALQPGDKLGSHEILAPTGAGSIEAGVGLTVWD